MKQYFHISDELTTAIKYILRIISDFLYTSLSKSINRFQDQKEINDKFLNEAM